MSLEYGGEVGGEIILVGSDSEPEHAGLTIGLEPEQTTHLLRLGVNDAGTAQIFGIGVDAIQHADAESLQLAANLVRFHRSVGLASCGAIQKHRR